MCFVTLAGPRPGSQAVVLSGETQNTAAAGNGCNTGELGTFVSAVPAAAAAPGTTTPGGLPQLIAGIQPGAGHRFVRVSVSDFFWTDFRMDFFFCGADFCVYRIKTELEPGPNIPYFL